jgi:M6 family metalloprotease-like protein
MEYTDPLATYNTVFNSTTGASVQGYFLEESNNQLTVSTTFYPMAMGGIVRSYQDSNPRSYYQPQSPSNPGGYPAGPAYDPSMYGFIRLHTMLVNAVNMVGPTIPPHLNLDADNDGSVDNIGFICKGAPDGWSDVLWPHYWALDAYYPTVPLAYINGMLADDYNFELQVGLDAAVICHEFSHTMGFPDLYHYSFDGLDPCGYWDLMDWCQGTPQHHLTYMKWKYGGWFGGASPLPAAGTVTLNAVANNPFDCYMFQMPTGEQIWLEYRKMSGNYETRVPGSGLLIYRVNQGINGNASGPPDEVYVYRPYVNPGNPNGNLFWAHYAWEQGQTAMNQFTDPAPFSQSMPGFIAPLNIYSVGSNLGSSITFDVGTVIPVIWTGAYNTNWFHGGNWSTLVIPNATDFVIIAPSQTGQSCSIPMSPTPAVCNDLRVEAQLNLQANSILYVGGNLSSIGRIYMDGLTMQISGDCVIDYWYMGSLLQCSTPINNNAQIRVGGNCHFGLGTNINLTVGSLIFFNPGTNTLSVDTVGIMLNNVIVSKSGGALSLVGMVNNPINIIGSLSVYAGSSFSLDSNYDIFIDGNISVDPTGSLYANTGTLILRGLAGVQSINIANAASYLNNVKVDNSTGLITNLANNITIKGAFSINQGSFYANTHTMNIHGVWANLVGVGGFQKGSSRVVFCGATDQMFSLGGSAGLLQEDFYTLELAKPSGLLHINTPGMRILCDQYDYSSGTLKVSQGLFTAYALLDNSICGDYIIENSGMVDLLNPVGSLDIDAMITISGSGAMNIHGGTTNSIWPGMIPGITKGINMSGGTLAFHNVGVQIGPPSPSFTMTISGGVIRVAGDFHASTPHFNPTGGTVEFIGSGTSYISQSIGSGFQRILINRSNSSDATYLYTDVTSTLLDITCGELYLNGNTLSNTGNTNIGSNGSLYICPGSSLQSGTGASVIVASGGKLVTSGNTRAISQLCGISGQYWNLNVESGGFISSSNSAYKHLKDAGVWVKTGATIDTENPFENCSFSLGEADCKFLTISNNQNISITNISFESGNGEGYNINKTADEGEINIQAATGNFAGPLYELDPYNRIQWAGFYGNLLVNSLIATDDNPYVADQIEYQVSIANDTDYAINTPFNVHLFLNREAPPEPGDTGDYSFTVDALDANTTYEHAFTAIYSMSPTAWHSYIFIDPEEAVTESNEADNRDDIPVIWHELPQVEDVEIDASGRISWSYPIWATRYKLYECTEPYGTYTYLGSSTESFFDVSLSEDMYFYKVTAERDDPYPTK